MSVAVLFSELENEARKELIEVLDGLLDKNEQYWWENRVLNSLLPHQQVYVKDEKLDSLDLNSLVATFVFNNKSFLDKKHFSSNEYKDLAMKVRYIRNTIAHLPGALEINLTSEKIIYFLMAYKLFFRKFRDLYSSEQPIVFKVINENLKKQMRRFLEAHGEEVKGDNELDKSENKILDLSRKMDMIYEKLNQKKIDMLDQNNEEESPYESSGDVTNTEHLNIEEARDILVGLREDYRREYKDIPREEGILTNSIIDFIIQNQIFEKEVLLKSPSEIIGKVNKRQFEKIEDILSVIKRVRFE
tara:strand:+ start:1940 stop:2845 length:906 start_codon:yes stop_codon:yes gene_type:complete